MGGEYRDVELVCSDCHEPFLFSAGQQKFYAKKGLHTPKRCKECSRKRKAKGTYGAQVVQVDTRTSELLCKRCSRPASHTASWAMRDALCRACAAGRDPRKEVTPDHDRVLYDEWEAYFNAGGNHA